MAAIAAHGICHLDIRGHLGHYALLGLARLAKKLVNVLRFNGTDALYRYVKSAADECR